MTGRIRGTAGFALTLILAGIVGAATVNAEQSDTSSGILDPLDKERLGTKIHCVMGRNFHATDDSLYLGTITHMAYGSGQGHNLLFWRRPLEGGTWTLTPIRPERMPGMISVLPREGRHGETLFLYVDRQDEAERVVYLERFTEEHGLEEVFEYSNGAGVLNPVAIPAPDTPALHVLIPDRTDTYIRWFVIDRDTNEAERLDDIPMPRTGARLYDYHVEGARLILPTAVSRELHLLVIDLETAEYEMKHLDTAESPDNQPPRNMTIHPFHEQGLYVITYLRPTSFSDRPRTGLVGEVVAHAVCMERLTSVEHTVIGGFNAEGAATHHINSAKISEDAFVMAHTTVDEVHQRHVTGEYENFVSGHVNRWRLTPDGGITAQAENDMEPFEHPGLVAPGDGMLYMVYNTATEESPKWLKRWRID